MKKALKIFLGLAAAAALLALASCENVTSAKDDPNINVAPERPSLVPGNQKLNARWTAVAGASGYKVYVAASETADKTEWARDAVIMDGTKLVQIVLTGLDNDREYVVWTQAVYPHGLSPLSEPATGKPTAPPATPTGFALSADDEMLIASWGAWSGFGGEVGSYELAVSETDLGAGFVFNPQNEGSEDEQRSEFILSRAGRLIETGADAGTALIDGLANGTAYYVWLRAKNTAGGSNFTAVQTGTPVCAGPPAAPASLTVTAGNKKLSLSWPAATNASSYAVYKSSANNPAGAELVQEGIRPKIGDNTAVVTGLVNGTRTYVWVVARNSLNRTNDAASGTAKDGSGIPAPKPAPDYGNNATVLGSMTARFVDEEFGKGDRLARKQETALADLTADAAVWWAREHAAEYGMTGSIDFAFFNGGYIGGGHAAGPVTVGSLRQVYTGTHGGGSAFSYTTLTGAQVKSLFEFVATILHNGGGGHPTGAFGQVSREVTYTINYSYGDPLYGTLENLKVHGQPVDPAREYRIFTSTWLCEGGDGYGAYLYSNRQRNTGVTGARIVAEYVWDQDLPLEPVTDGRITLIGAVWSGAAH